MDTLEKNLGDRWVSSAEGRQCPWDPELLSLGAGPKGQRFFLGDTWGTGRG